MSKATTSVRVAVRFRKPPAETFRPKNVRSALLVAPPKSCSILWPMRFSILTSALALTGMLPLLASDLPTLKQALPDVTVAQGTSTSSVDLRNHFEITGIQGQVVQFRCVLGAFNLEMLPAAAPQTVTNFLRYANAGRFVNNVVHRSDKSLGVIQGGQFSLTSTSLPPIETYPPIPLEYNLPNARGTIAMARGTNIHSATCQYFINTKDNTTTLGQANDGGYAVFGRVTGTGMTVVDAIADLPIYVWGTNYLTWPMINYAGGTAPVTYTNLIAMSTAQVVPLFPDAAGQPAVATFTMTNSNPALATAVVEGSFLRITPATEQSGTAHLTVVATDSNGNAVQDTFQFTVTRTATGGTSDVNGDGMDDILWQDASTTEVGAWLLPTKSWFWISPGNNGAWKVVGLADVDGDGRSDMVWQDATTTEVGAWLLPSKAWRWISPGNNGAWKVVTTGDVNGDGKADLIWQNTATTEVGAWLMPSGTWYWVSPGNNGPWKVAAVADVNGDGTADVVWQSASGTEVGAWLLPAKTWEWISPGNNGAWKVVGAADANGDGKTDLLWQNSATTEVGSWLLPSRAWYWISPGNNGTWRVNGRTP